MAKKKHAAAALSHAEHVALLEAEHAVALTRARASNATLRRNAHEAMAERDALKAKEALRESLAALNSDIEQSYADGQAALHALSNLTEAIRKTHNLTERHAIDSATGAIILPEA